MHFQVSVETGTGHGHRCAVLARVLADLGHKIEVLSDEDTLRWSEVYFPPGTSAVQASPLDSAFGDVLRRNPYDTLVLDRYDIALEREKRIAELVGSLVVIDDFVGRQHHCHQLIDPNLSRTPSDWRGALAPKCLALAGSAYALLRSEFLAARANRPNIEERGDDRVFICFGGADPYGLTYGALKAFDAPLADGVNFDIVVGQHTRNLDELVELAAGLDGVTLYRGCDQMAALMGRAAVAVGAPGVMTLERACLGIPSLLVSFADNQIAIGQAAASTGIAVYLGDWREATSEELARQLSELLSSPPARREMSRNGVRHVDGRGAIRVAAALCPARDRSGEPIFVRSMTLDDMETVFIWQNSECMRRHSLNPNPISWDEHRDWCGRRLKERSMDTYIAHDEDQNSVGFIHLAPHTDDAWLVSLLVAPECQGRGVGQAMLDQVTRIYGTDRLCAVISAENEPSLKIFERCGFVDEGEMFVRAPSSSGSHSSPL